MTFQEPTIEQQSKESELDKNLFKTLLIGIFGVTFSVASFFSFSELLSSITLPHFLLWLLFSFLFLSVIILQTFLTKSLGKLFVMCVAEVFFPLLFLSVGVFPYIPWVIFVGAGIFLLFLFTAVREGWVSLRESLAIKFSFVSRNILSRAGTGFLIFLSLITYTWYFQLNRFNPADGYMLMSASIVSVEPMVHVFFPEASLNQPVDAFFKKVAEAELRKIPIASSTQENGTTMNFSILTKQQQEKAITEASEMLRLSFERTLGQPLEKSVLVKDVLFSFIQGKIEKFSGETKNYFGFIVVFLLFSTLKGFFALFGWGIRFFAFLLYKILLMVGFSYITIETRTREFLLLK